MISIFVTLQVKAGHVDEFIDASFGDSQGSVKDEPGCYRFDILQNSNDTNKFHLYGVYEDEKSLATHRNTSHYRKWRKQWEIGWREMSVA